MSSSTKLSRLILAALFLAIALILPLFTGQIPKVGEALLPMHFPILLCGFFCGPVYAGIAGFIAPLLRFLIFGMPPIFPKGIWMACELATYGLMSGLLYKILPKKKASVYISLIGAMLAGRIVWGVVKATVLGAGGSEFGMAAFITGGFVEAIPGIAIQIILIPIIVLAIKKNDFQ